MQQNRQPIEWDNIFANTSDKALISKIYKVLIKLNTRKNKQPNSKMGKGPEQMLLQGRHIDGQQTYEKMLNVINHQRDAN